MARALLLILIASGACSQGGRVAAGRRPGPSAPPRAAVAGAVHEGAEVDEDSVSEILAAARGLRAIAIFPGDEELGGEWLIVSAMTEADRGASCLSISGGLRCVDFAGYDRDHLVHVFSRQKESSVPTPEWAGRVLAVASKARMRVDVHLDDSGPVLGLHEELGVRFAVKRDARWRASEPMSGGKISAPFYFGSIDLTPAFGRPAIGILVGGYIKEGCVRSETDELVILHIEEELEEQGRIEIGRAVWIATEDDRYGPFDPNDPNHYLIQLKPTLLPTGELNLDIAERHTPQNLATTCGVDLDTDDIDSLQALIGRHSIRDLLRAQ